MAENLADKYARYEIENAATNQRLKDFARGAAKAITTDLPGFVMDVADKLAGDTAYLGQNKRSDQLFEKLTGSKSTGTAQEDLGGLFNLPGAAMKAVILPAIAVKSFAEVKGAKKLLDAGTDAQEVYTKTGVFSAPVTGDLRTVISDANARIKPGVLNRSSSHSVGGPNQILSMDAWNDLPLNKVLDHPELFRASPEIGNLSVRGGLGFNSAKFYPDTGHIVLGAASSEKSFMENILHEIQHGLQERYSMPGGGAPGNFLANPKELTNAIDSIKDAQGVVRKQIEATIDPSEKAAKLNNLSSLVQTRAKLEGVKSNAFTHYETLAGEAEARSVERMFSTRDYSTLPTAKKFYQEVSPESLILDSKAVMKVDSDPAIQAIIDAAARYKLVADSIKK